MAAYTRLARLPPPNKRSVDLAGILRRVARLEQRCVVAIGEIPSLTLRADADQLEQALINLTKNAAEAALEAGGGVRIRLYTGSTHIRIEIEDDGPGLAKTENLFVPFFMHQTRWQRRRLGAGAADRGKPRRQPALGNRTDARGCLVTLTLPWTE